MSTHSISISAPWTEVAKNETVRLASHKCRVAGGFNRGLLKECQPAQDGRQLLRLHQARSDIKRQSSIAAATEGLEGW